MNVLLICVVVTLTAVSINGYYRKWVPGYATRPHNKSIPGNQGNPSEKCVCGKIPLITNRDRSNEELAVRVVGGTKLFKYEIPMLATIYNNGDFVCGGSIVSPYHILTAAHCVEDSEEKDMQVYLGVYDKNNLEKADFYPVKRIIEHRGYKDLNGTFVINDLALLQVDRIKFKKSVQPLCLPFNNDFQDVVKAAVAGWGVTTFNGATSRFPQGATLEIMSPRECMSSAWGATMAMLPDSEKMVICAYKPAVDACQGDSGGPLYIRTPGGTAYQIGIISFGDECGNSEGVPGMYMKVSYFRDWLREHLQDAACSESL